jgi:hypothetical protein
MHLATVCCPQHVITFHNQQLASATEPARVGHDSTSHPLHITQTSTLPANININLASPPGLIPSHPCAHRCGSIQTSVLDSLVRTILSQNTTDLTSHRAFASLKASFPTWQQVMAAKDADVAAAIRVGGLADIKAQRIKVHSAAQLVLAHCSVPCALCQALLTGNTTGGALHKALKGQQRWMLLWLQQKALHSRSCVHWCCMHVQACSRCPAQHICRDGGSWRHLTGI